VKKTESKKMTLSRETLRLLEKSDIKNAAGGRMPITPDTCDDSDCYAC